MKVYISGKITGLPKDEYIARFAAAEERLKGGGFSVINPAKTNSTLPEDTTYEQYMQMSLMMLTFCDAIYMLDGWKESKGAVREYNRAKSIGLSVIYETEKEG